MYRYKQKEDYILNTQVFIYFHVYTIYKYKHIQHEFHAS